MGFPVRVIATSDTDLRWRAFWAILEVDRMAVGREAILGAFVIATRQWSRSMGRFLSLGKSMKHGLGCLSRGTSNQMQPIPKQ